jgi:hypothetical protein
VSAGTRKRERFPFHNLREPLRVKRWFIFDADGDGFLVGRIIVGKDTIWAPRPSSCRFTRADRAALIAHARRVRMERAERRHGVGNA